MERSSAATVRSSKGMTWSASSERRRVALCAVAGLVVAVATAPGEAETDLTLLDFNDETIENTSQVTAENAQNHGRKTGLKFVKKSVQQILKESAKSGEGAKTYDLVYCAGLFDYVSDRVCKLLIDTFYESVNPGGTVILTNVNASKPFRHSMDYLLEWHLVYRDERHMSRLLPVLKPAAQYKVDSDDTGVNLFLQIRKPATPP